MKLYRHQKIRSERVRTRKERHHAKAPLALFGGFPTRSIRLWTREGTPTFRSYIGFDRFDEARA